MNVNKHSLLAALVGVAATFSAHAETTPHVADWHAEMNAKAIEEMREIALTNPEEVTTILRLAAMLSDQGMLEESDALLADLAARTPDLDVILQTRFGNACDGCERGGVGPDVIVGDLSGIGIYTGSGAVGGIMAFSVGTTSCNLGDTPLEWYSSTNRHPVIGQNMFRLKDGRFEQIGMSWLKHGFLALTQNLCGTCQPPGCGCLLGVNCSDPYGASLNGSYTYLGPRWQVNAATGFFTYPFATAPNNSPIGKRLQVHVDDMNPALNSGALYFVEGQYVTPDDHAAGNGHNNASYRRFTYNWSSTNQTVSGTSFAGNTVRQKPGILAWQDFEPGVTIVYADVIDEGGAGVHGRFIVGYKVFDNGDGTWDYEYAIQNLTSHRSGQSFSVPVGNGVTLTNVGFQSPPHHSGDGENGVTRSNAPWSYNVPLRGGAMMWSTQTFTENNNANALRWGTLYNFRFTADTPPKSATATIGLYRPGTPSSIAVEIVAPAGCELDGDFTGDGAVDFDDFSEVLSGYGTTYDFDDFSAVLANYGQEC